jgi:hypothetical protein
MLKACEREASALTAYKLQLKAIERPTMERFATRDLLACERGQTMTTVKTRFLEVVYVGIIAGLAGGLAEVAWISVYGAISGVSIDLVATEVTRSILPSFGASSSSAWVGVLIHFILAIGLGMGVAFAIRLLLRQYNLAYAEHSLVVLALATVWAVNFLVALPYLNPGFVNLLPYSVTLVSKLLFGVSAATVFRIERMRLVRTASP